VVLRALLEAGSPVDTANGGGWTALHWSCHTGQLGASAALLVAGADADAAHPGGVAPLMSCVGRGDAAGARLLLDFGADPRRLDGRGGTALHYASAHGHQACAELLLAAGADLAEEVEAGLALDPVDFPLPLPDTDVDRSPLADAIGGAMTPEGGARRTIAEEAERAGVDKGLLALCVLI
jgi:ankyrin repeat protein